VASFVPSLDDVMVNQYFVLPTEVFSVQVAPESVEVQMFPFKTVAASFVPSLDDVMPYHSFVLPTEMSSVQVAPESVEVQMFPTWTVAASLVPSLDDVMAFQSFIHLTWVSTVSDNRETSRTLTTLWLGIVRIRRSISKT
jgi:hypothetical protein